MPMEYMTQHKKCHMHYCNNIASKQIEVVVPTTEGQFGGWIRSKELRSVHHTVKNIIRKKKRYNICSICYDTVEPSDFTFTDLDGNVHHATAFIRND